MNDDGQMFVPLHVHTDCSLLDGYQTVQEYCAYVDEHGYVAAAITDHGTCMGHEMFDWEVRSKGYGFKPIFGIEAYLTDDVTNTMSDRPVRDRKGVVKLDKAGMPMFEKQRPKDFNHGCLWAKDQTGLHNLWTLSTLGYTEGFYYKPRIDLKMMREHHEGLFVSDGCMLSQVSRAIVAGDMDRAREWELKLMDVFGPENVLVELHTWRFIEPRDDEERRLNEEMRLTNERKVELARELGLRLIAVNDAHYNRREDWTAHEMEWQSTTKKGAEFNDDKTGGQSERAAWVMDTDDVFRWLTRNGVDADTACEAIANTRWVADRCNAVIERDVKPPRFMDTREEDERRFDELVTKGIRELMPRVPSKVGEYMDELNAEVELIRKADLTGYFNTVADYANFVRADDPDGAVYGIPGKRASVLGPARGSAGGSLVCYLMGITNVDPLQFGLFFERFLTAGRVMKSVTVEYADGSSRTFAPSDEVRLADGTAKEAWQQLDETWDTEYGRIVSSSYEFRDCPDIDLDFEVSVIPQLNAYFRLRYGDTNVAQIGTQQSLKLSMAIKDIGRVDGMEPAYTQELVNRVSASGWPVLDPVADHGLDEFREWICDTHRDDVVAALFDKGDFFERVWKWAGRFRSEGINASGYILSKRDLMGALPMRVKDGQLVSQIEHNGVARMGFIKYDILKLTSLQVVRDCYELTHDGRLDLPEVYAMMRDEELLSQPGMWDSADKGDTLGIFQMDTTLGTKTAMNAHMRSLRDAGMLSAVDRPGLVSSGLIDEFYKVRMGAAPPMQYHPFIDDILAETSGFVIYQEQIMSIFGRLCGYTATQRDDIRKIIGKKMVHEMPKQKAVLDECCLSDPEFVRLVPSKYADAKECVDDIWNAISGAGSYAFNKAHSLAYGMITSIEQLFKWRHPNEFITASLNANKGDPQYITYAVTHGLSVMPPNVNASTDRFELRDGSIYMPIDVIKGVGPTAVDEIIKGAPYASFDDYCERTSGKGGRKKTVMEALISLGAFDGVDPRDRSQLMAEWKRMRKEEPVRFEGWRKPKARGAIEKKLLGVSLSWDPLLDNADWVASKGPTDLGLLSATKVGDWVTVPGQVSGIRRHQQKNGEQMAWVGIRLLSHEEVEVTFFARTWASAQALLATGDIVAVRAKRDKDWNGRLSLKATGQVDNLSVTDFGKDGE